ncbi:ribonuclease Z [Candidatus Woesearchaeota archaeon]|nr:ribonuclease Z [Candidatus Woesearchaeota archaeon]
MSYEITFLGTSSMVPTKDRNVQSIYLEYNGEGILIDCGEGTQRQMNIKGINRLKVKKILISHWHGDHVSGLIGLIQTIGNGNREEQSKLTIYGPLGTKKHMEHLLQSCIFDLNLDLEINELNIKQKNVIYENEDYMIEAAPLEHSTPCLGYSFIEKDRRNIQLAKAKKLGLREGPNLGKLQRGHSIKHEGKEITPDMVSTIKKGKKTTFILDTGLTENCYLLAENSDLLICESTLSIKLAEKAELRKHMTAQGAAQIASKAGTKKLILTHFSQRYTTLHDLEEEAKAVFPNTDLAFDFMKVKL